MSTIRDVNSTGEEIKNEPQEIVSHGEITAPVIPELQVKAIAEVMGLDSWKDTARYQDQIDNLLEWAKTQTTNHSLESLKNVIRELEIKIGTPPLAEKKINYISRYIYLDMESKKIEKEKNMLIQKGRVAQ